MDTAYRPESREIGQTQLAEIDRQTFYREVLHYQHERNYKRGWAAHKFKDKFGHFPPWDWNKLERIETSPATLRWIKSRIIAYAKARAAA